MLFWKVVKGADEKWFERDYGNGINQQMVDYFEGIEINMEKSIRNTTLLLTFIAGFCKMHWERFSVKKLMGPQQ